MASPKNTTWTVIDLFSGAGGMSRGFHAHSDFELVGAFDGEFGKPSSGKGTLGCNETYRLNMRLIPTAIDLGTVSKTDVPGLTESCLAGRELDVLSACPPCTGFSRANPRNHLDDDHRNDLVERTAIWAEVLKPRVIVMENARELLQGNFSHHFSTLRKDLESLGYDVRATVHRLDRFGLPQRRERALVVAARRPLIALGLEDLWEGHTVREDAVTVRRAIGHLPRLAAGEADPIDPIHVSPGMTEESLERFMAIPLDGGSWSDLRFRPDASRLMTPGMRRYVAAGDLGSHPDAYGRMAWDRPAVTIKRECAHLGNGRYGHPEQHRLATVREMAILQGFPRDYEFRTRSLANMYRHIGDAVPPMISYQLAWLAKWILSGVRPRVDECVLGNTSLLRSDIVSGRARGQPRDVDQLSLFST